MPPIKRSERRPVKQLPDNLPRRGERRGIVTSWAPQTGRGIVELKRGGDDFAFDVMKTHIANRGYVDFYVGEEVSLKVKGDAITLLRSLAERRPPEKEPIAHPLPPRSLWGVD